MKKLLSYLFPLFDRALIMSVLGFLILLIIITNIVGENQHYQFALLSQSFIHGKTDLPYYVYDAAIFNGKIFWPLGPFPAIVLTPILFLWRNIPLDSVQGYTHAFFAIAVIFIVAKMMKTIGFMRQDPWWLALAFVGGLSFLEVSLIPYSWHFAHTIAVFVELAALWLWMRKRTLLCGIAFSILLLTRVTAWITILVPLCVILFDARQETMGKTMRRLALLLFPTVIAVFLLLIYNNTRFGNPFEQGYQFQHLAYIGLAIMRSYGIMDIVHIPGNLYYLFFGMPEPIFRDNISHVLSFPYFYGNNWGTSIFLTTPYLIVLFLGNYHERIKKILLGACVATLIPILFYYGIGGTQFGYRYSLDFFPVLFILFALVLKDRTPTISRGMKLLIAASFLFNFFIIFSA